MLHVGYLDSIILAVRTVPHKILWRHTVSMVVYGLRRGSLELVFLGLEERTGANAYIARHYNVLHKMVEIHGMKLCHFLLVRL